MKKLAMPAGRQGFTLIELLVSIAIIATLTAILLPNFMGARQKAGDSQQIQDMNSIKDALRLYYNDHQSYPGLADNTVITNVDVGYSLPMTPVGIGFTYCRTGGGDGFLLYAHLSSTQGTDIADSQSRCAVGSPVCGNGSEALGTDMYFVCAK